MDMDVFRFRFANGEFVPADSNFNGISQRGDFADEYLRSLGNPHVHDASSDRAFPRQFADGDGFPDEGISQCTMFGHRIMVGCWME